MKKISFYEIFFYFLLKGGLVKDKYKFVSLPYEFHRLYTRANPDR